MPFRNRDEAARRLVDQLAEYRGRHPLVLGIPRGAVPMAEIIAEALGGDLDVVLVHKLGAPGQPELAIGSVDEGGAVYRGAYVRELGISEEEIAREARAQLAVLRQRRARYTPVHPPIDPAGRLVIVVDDGIATGSTMIAALHAVRARKPETLIAAAGVAPREVFKLIEKEADAVVCLETPALFYAVGQFFEEFPQVTDEEVMAILQRSRTQSAARGGG